jgi:hypothetical protein
VRAAEAAYRQHEAAANGAAKALERINLQASSKLPKLQAQMQAALAEGNEAAFWKAATASEALKAKQLELAGAAGKAADALKAEAASLDALKAGEKAASKHAATLVDTHGKASAAAAGVKKAQDAMKPTGNLGKLSGALNQLGGPLGKASGGVVGLGDAMGDLGETVGKAGPYVALAVAVVALSTAFIGAGIAATTWFFKMGGGMAELTKTQERFKKLSAGLFSGPKIKAGIKDLNKGIGTMVDLFDENSATGRGMKVVLDDLGGKLLSFASSLIPKVVAGFIQLQIWTLKGLIAIKPYGSYFEFAAKAMLGFAGVIVGVVLLALGSLLANIALVGTVIGTVAIALWTLPKNIQMIWASVTEFFRSISLVEIGKNLVLGLANGVKDAAMAVVRAITGVVTGGIDAAKRLLGIASPSKVFAEIGHYTGEGMAVGVDRSAKGVQTSLESMVTPPDAVAATAPTGAAGGTIGNITINVNGAGGDGDSIAAKIREVLLDVLEGDVTQMGGSYA